MQLFYESYVLFFAVSLPLLAVSIGMIGVTRANFSPNQTGLFILISALLFGGWFAISMPLSIAGVFNVPATLADPPVVLMFLFVGSGLIWALAWLTPLGKKATLATPLSAIAAFQIPRIMGGLFLIGWMFGEIPALFAIPAGIGDILAGLAGWKASKALARNSPDGQNWLRLTNLIGMADFVMAIVLGMVTSKGLAHLYSQNAPNIINDYPLAFFPAYFVPIFLGFHFIAISRLKYERQMGRKKHA